MNTEKDFIEELDEELTKEEEELTKDKAFEALKADLLASLPGLFTSLKADLDCSEDSSEFLDVTISTNKACNRWNYQTGDNSYTGSCYGDEHWAVISIDPESDVNERAYEVVSQLEDLVFSY